ncbi:MAG: hypothetical protein ABW124_08845, partial [Candidatus Thiodiazotropha sp. 6PLUC9]
YVDEVNDENRRLIVAVAPYADVAHNSYELLKSIAVISAKQPYEAYTIWLKMLENSTPDYPEEAIQTILANLIKDGPEGIRKAKEAVSIYLKVANEKPAKLLRELISSDTTEAD